MTIRYALPCGRYTLIDHGDLGKLDGRNWFSDIRKNTVYVRGREPGGKRHVYLHSIIVGGTADHINGDGLDNRRSNLRLCTQKQNCLNAGRKRTHKRFKGTYYDSRRGKWWAQIYIGGKSFFGGYHDSEEDAARSYDSLAIKHHGEFARLNCPVNTTEDAA